MKRRRLRLVGGMGSSPSPLPPESNPTDVRHDAPDRAECFETLTAAELRVLYHLPTHHTLAAIARQLYIAHSTAKTHSLSVYRKLHVGNRADAVQRAIELGLLNESNLVAAEHVAPRPLRLVSPS